MSEFINAKGLNCPQPVVLTKKALDNFNDVTVLVDNDTAVENIKRLAESNGCKIDITNLDDGTYKINLLKTNQSPANAPLPQMIPCQSPAGGPIVCVISSDTMGKGNDDLGRILMKAFLHTLIEVKPMPDIMILYNAGVKLAAQDSDVLDDLNVLDEKGVQILVCGTCVNFFELKEKLGVGKVSNMYDIASILSTSGRIVTP